MNPTPAALGLLLALLCGGCSTASTSIVIFRSPRGSELVLEGDEESGAGSVTFPGRLQLTQFVGEGDESSRAVRGTLRVNRLVEENRIPSELRGLLVDAEGGVDLRVKGSYRVYERPPRDEPGLETFEVDLTRQRLLSVLSEEGLVLSVGEPAAFQLTLRVDREE